MDELLQSYEDAPYPGGAFPETHPDTLATAAWLAGLEPPAVEKCRFLEIGSGTSVNLLGMAMALPESQFVGVDLSPAQIAFGQKLAAELGVTNLELIAGDILEVGPALGEFDYIVVHGVYSWCPPPVQDAILSVCAGKLSPNGIAYLSYNVLPGWRKMASWRDLAQFGAGSGDWRERVAQARRFVEKAADASTAASWQRRLREGADEMRGMADAYLLHEYLEPFNETLLFSELASRAAEKGLQYLGDAGRQPNLGALPPPVMKWLGETRPNRIELEQALDFFRNTGFRRSLFCSRRLPVQLPDPSRLPPLSMSSLADPVSPQPDVPSEKPEEFRTSEGSLTTPRPLIKAVLVSLYDASPRPLSFVQLCAEVRRRLEAEDDPELSDELIAAAALNCHASNLLLLHRWTPSFAASAGERPLASPLARLELSRGLEVNNLRHRHVELHVFEAALLAKLDGTRDRAALVAELLADAENGRLSVGSELRQAENMAAALEEGLAGLAELALLVR
jgi:SAM-dependent methyltransferase